MDAKNLEVLQQVKKPADAGEDVAQTAPRPTVHVPGQGFSEESERIFIELAKKRIGAPSKSEYPARSLLDQEGSGLVIDRVTRELRQEIAALNKVAALKEAADRRAREKEERRLSKAARRRERQAAKTAKKTKASKLTKSPKPEPKVPERGMPTTAQSSSKWVEVICWRCKSKMVIHVEWVNPPGLCKPCRKYLNETHLPSTGKDRSTNFSYVRIVRGGAPGLGKRH